MDGCDLYAFVSDVQVLDCSLMASMGWVVSLLVEIFLLLLCDVGLNWLLIGDVGLNWSRVIVNWLLCGSVSVVLIFLICVRGGGLSCMTFMS